MGRPSLGAGGERARSQTCTTSAVDALGLRGAVGFALASFGFAGAALGLLAGRATFSRGRGETPDGALPPAPPTPPPPPAPPPPAPSLPSAMLLCGSDGGGGGRSGVGTPRGETARGDIAPRGDIARGDGGGNLLMSPVRRIACGEAGLSGVASGSRATADGRGGGKGVGTVVPDVVTVVKLSLTARGEDEVLYPAPPRGEDERRWLGMRSAGVCSRLSMGEGNGSAAAMWPAPRLPSVGDSIGVGAAAAAAIPCFHSRSVCC